MLVADFKSVGGVTRSGSIPPSRCFSFDPKVVRFCAKTQHLCTLLGAICQKKAEKRCFEQFEALSCFSCLNALFAFATFLPRPACRLCQLSRHPPSAFCLAVTCFGFGSQVLPFPHYTLGGLSISSAYSSKRNYSALERLALVFCTPSLHFSSRNSLGERTICLYACTSDMTATGRCLGMPVPFVTSMVSTEKARFGSNAGLQHVIQSTLDLLAILRVHRPPSQVSSDVFLSILRPPCGHYCFQYTQVTRVGVEVTCDDPGTSPSSVAASNSSLSSCSRDSGSATGTYTEVTSGSCSRIAVASGFLQ